MRAFSLLFVLILLAGCAQDAAQTHGAVEHSYMGSHGMALLSAPDGRLLAHHLPLYSPPHDYQLIYEVRVANQEHRDAISKLGARPLVTLLPENFDLRTLIDGKAMSATTQVFEGHFERGGQAVMTVQLEFVQPIYVEAIELPSEPPVTDRAGFDIVAISDTHSLAVHRIATRPSFDALAWVPSDAGPRVACVAQSVADADALKQVLTQCLDATPVYLELQDFR